MLASFLVVSGTLAGIATSAGATSTQDTVATGYPLTPPAHICDNPDELSGPSSPPAGAIRVPAGDNHDLLDHEYFQGVAGLTYWFAPGVHTLGPSEFGQISPLKNTTYIGAPGAILDGQKLNRYAFTYAASGVTIRYLTIQNFVTPNNEGTVNHNSGSSWTIEHSTIRDNGGAGLFLGSNNVIRYNCLTRNGQWAFTNNTGVSAVTMDHNEISFNNADDVQCCSAGGGKFWAVRGAMVTNNWVHHNYRQGLWADTNAVDFVIEGNYINDNDAEGIFYEASYNAYIHNNTLKRNALVKGRSFADRGATFPVSAIYISESGGDSRLPGHSPLEISGNYLEDNWGGVTLWENADRFCNTTGSTAEGECPQAGVGTIATCVPGTIEVAPYLSDCRWKTQNVLVHDNDFRVDKGALDCVGTQCGQVGIFSKPGETPPWSPYLGNVVQEAITFNQGNRFYNNSYVGDWHFDGYDIGRVLDFATWRAAPYAQDAGSTLVAAPAVARVTAAPPTVGAGGQVSVSWSGIATPTATDWVGLYAVGAPDSAYRSWQYTGGASDGATTLTVPTSETTGPHEVRLFANDGYTL
ncbi:MAG: right-handed parallel beta-helix repeat-containing protein, partial [Actinomycetota bacterium]|nr:right-handed parallel beta-helix repeat-containing protein [Actinomycetota bacterium]